MTKKIDISNFVLTTFMLIIGSLISAVAIEEFLVAKQILDGGLTGISIILNNLTKLKLSIFIIVLNIPFLILGLKQLGKSFAIKSAFSMILFSCFLFLFENVDEFTDDPLLATVYGGVFLGLGVGIVLKAGGSIDGIDTLALLLSKKNKFFNRTDYSWV